MRYKANTCLKFSHSCYTLSPDQGQAPESCTNSYLVKPGKNHFPSASPARRLSQKSSFGCVNFSEQHRPLHPAPIHILPEATAALSRSLFKPRGQLETGSSCRSRAGCFPAGGKGGQEGITVGGDRESSAEFAVGNWEGITALRTHHCCHFATRAFTAASCLPCSPRNARASASPTSPHLQHTALQALSCRGCPCRVQPQLLQQGLREVQRHLQKKEAVFWGLTRSFPWASSTRSKSIWCREKPSASSPPGCCLLNTHLLSRHEDDSNPEPLAAPGLCCTVLEY